MTPLRVNDKDAGADAVSGVRNGAANGAANGAENGTGNSTGNGTGSRAHNGARNQAEDRAESGTDSGTRKHHGNRHGRSEQARVAVLQAADDLLVERGFAGVTIEGIASRAGVAKQTIYRWWNSKVDILMDTFLTDAEKELAVPDQGDVEQDLRLYLSRLADFLTTSDAGAVLRALIGQAQHDSDMARTLRTDYLARQREWERAIVQRAVDRGELAEELDLDRALDQLLGPVYFRVLVTGQPVEQSLTDALLERFLAEHRQPSGL